jgi:hypothetical protein
MTSPTQSELEKLLERSKEMREKADELPWNTQSNCDYRIVSETHVVCEADPKANFSHGMTQCIQNTAFIVHVANTSAAKDEIIRVLLLGLKWPSNMACACTIEPVIKCQRCIQQEEALAQANRIAAEVNK